MDGFQQHITDQDMDDLARIAEEYTALLMEQAVRLLEQRFKNSEEKGDSKGELENCERTWSR